MKQLNLFLADEITGAMADIGKDSDSAILNNIGSKLYGIILVVGGAVAIGILAIMAVKFMTSGAEEKAQVKKNLIGFTIGVLILLCVISILGVFQNMAREISEIGGQTGSAILGGLGTGNSGETSGSISTSPNITTHNTSPQNAGTSINIDPSKKNNLTSDQLNDLDLARKYLNGEKLEEPVNFEITYNYTTSDPNLAVSGEQPVQSYTYNVDSGNSSAKVVKISIDEEITGEEYSNRVNSIRQAAVDRRNEFREENKDKMDSATLSIKSQSEGSKAESAKREEISINAIKTNINKVYNEK